MTRMRRAANWPYRLSVALLFLILGGYIVWPMLSVLAQTFLTNPGELPDGARAFTWEHWRQALKPSNLRALGASLVLSAVSTALAAALGGALAALYSRWDFPGRSVCVAAAMLPLTLPPLVGVFAFWRMLNETGLIPRVLFDWFGVRFSLERGWAGVYLVHGYSFSVYFFIMLSAAIGGLDGSTFEAARNLGASRARVFFRVALPQLKPALVGGAILVFMTSMASFTAPYIYVNARDVLTLNIVRAFENNRAGEASILCLFMTASSFVLLWAMMAWTERTKHYSANKGAAPRPRRVVAKPARIALAALGATISLLLAAPHLYIALESFVRPGTWFLQTFPPAYTLDNYKEIFRQPDFLRPAFVSLKASAAAALGVAGFGLLAAWLVARKRFPGRAAAAILAMLPWALPGTVIAINLLEAFARPSIWTFGSRLHGTVAILALAYFIRYIPLAYRSTLASLEAMDPNLELAAMNLGASRARTLGRVTVPLIAPGLLAGTLLAFVTALGEFVSSILLYVSETMPISVRIYDLLRQGYEKAAAYSVLLMLLIAAALVFSAKALKTGGPKA
ncbi:MAG: Molybdenum transport system permease protein ModB [candidate division BRC1 bacterium ADurb.BinA364]|nr:MAG: Molybdenum transport system permease protein ModB [candidate division BRC1 bacterium ADurb.BinA364]